MSAVGVYDQIEKAFQDIVAPELHALRGDIRVLDQRIVGLDQRIVGLDQKIDGVDQRLSEKIDGVDARLATKIDGLRSETVSMKAELLARSAASTPGWTAWIASCGPRSTSASASRLSKLAAPPDG
ncbi:MAG: hypothetical protein DME11_00140 [Candidatus Rokuibacteriota bacterium]|nr:MAG: hypothetical protein DME11_00140 [Candidatus Rokubacteria bacterium]